VLKCIELKPSVFEGFEAPLLKKVELFACESPKLEFSSKLGTLVREGVDIKSTGWVRDYKQPW
jgi:hypothetical protein